MVEPFGSASWMLLEASWELLEGALGSSWRLGCSWRRLGIVDGFEASWELLEVCRSKEVWKLLEAYSRLLEASLGALGLPSSWGP